MGSYLRRFTENVQFGALGGGQFYVSSGGQNYMSPDTSPFLFEQSDFPQADLSFLADVAVAPDRQIRVEAHPNRQSLESFQVQRTKIKIQGRSRHATPW